MRDAFERSESTVFMADGYAFAARYLVPTGWKALTKWEADAINAAGMQIVSVFETTADRALGGRSAGLVDSLAQNGFRYNNFNVIPLCSPTRACLLTGRNCHSVGVGMVTEIDWGPEYPNKRQRPLLQRF